MYNNLNSGEESGQQTTEDITTLIAYIKHPAIISIFFLFFLDFFKNFPDNTEPGHSGSL